MIKLLAKKKNTSSYPMLTVFSSVFSVEILARRERLELKESCIISGSSFTMNVALLFKNLPSFPDWFRFFGSTRRSFGLLDTTWNSNFCMSTLIVNHNRSKNSDFFMFLQLDLNDWFSHLSWDFLSGHAD